MSGAVFLGGGGSPDNERDVWQMAYRGVDRALYWPFALAGDIFDTAEEWLRSSLASLGLGPEVMTWTSLTDHSDTELEDFDLLHVGGGNTFRLLDHIATHAFIEPVRRFVERGGRYYGGSAGAVLACADIEIATPHDPNEVGLADLSALALIPGYSVLPHYNGMVDVPLSWVREHDRCLLAVPERGGIRYEDNIFTAIGPDPSAEFTTAGVTARPVGMSWTHPIHRSAPVEPQNVSLHDDNGSETGRRS